MTTKKFQSHKSTIGNADANLIALLAYVLIIIGGNLPIVGSFPFVLPLILYFVEKESEFVRFSAMQAALFSLAFSVILFIVRLLTFGLGAASFLTFNMVGLIGLTGVGGLIMGVLGILYIIAAIYAAYKAYQNEALYLPVLGDITNSVVQRTGGN